MKTVFIAGATGYLGRFLVEEYQAQGWSVIALVRSENAARKKGIQADKFVEAQATVRETLFGAMQTADLVISCVGITRQRDGLTYRDVDYQANMNLLEEALEASVPRFCYIHVLNAHAMTDVLLVRAKQDFVEELRAAAILSTIVEPSGYFSDMADFLQMAKSGRVYLFGNGKKRLNPIHGADLAHATYDAIADENGTFKVGGPKIYTHDQLAELTFTSVGKPVKITHLPEYLIDVFLWVLCHFTGATFYGPIQFFMSAMRIDMVGEQHGTRQLSDHFARLAAPKKREN